MTFSLLILLHSQSKSGQSSQPHCCFWCNLPLSSNNSAGPYPTKFSVELHGSASSRFSNFSSCSPSSASFKRQSVLSCHTPIQPATQLMTPTPTRNWCRQYTKGSLILVNPTSPSLHLVCMRRKNGRRRVHGRIRTIRILQSFHILRSSMESVTSEAVADGLLRRAGTVRYLFHILTNHYDTLIAWRWRNSIALDELRNVCTLNH